MSSQPPLFLYTLRLADNALVLGHRLSEWIGHAPVLEEDLALGNMGLDLIGQARSFYAYAGELEGRGRGEDDLAYFREAGEWRNVLLVEQPNRDFAVTMVRQLLFAAFAQRLYAALSHSSDATLAAIATKAEKEMAYHVRHAGEWVIRLGDGTTESAARTQDALDLLWPFTGELFEADDIERGLIAVGIAAHPAPLKSVWEKTVSRVIAEAALTRPRDGWMQSGGRSGLHTEYLGLMLAEMQVLGRAHPGAVW